MKLVRKISFADIYKNSIFRATNKWIRINVTFKEKITLKDHKHRFRIYHNCFRAQTGVDIMFEVLKELNTTKKTVTRNQVNEKDLKLYSFECKTNDL